MGTGIRNDVIKFLIDAGWVEAGVTRMESYRTHSLAYGGGSIVTTGNKPRFKKGDWTVTVGMRTTTFFKKPANPESIPGRGPMAMKQVYTFRDWETRNFPTKDINSIKGFALNITLEDYDEL